MADLEYRLTLALEQSKNWMAMNKLTMNTDKTKAMTIGTTYTTSQIENLTVKTGNTDIEVVDSYKYLGVVLDKNLKFDNHVDYMKRKLVGRLRMLSKLRPILKETTALHLYKTLLVPILDYCDIMYDCLSKYNSEILQRLQNGACRIILKTGKRTPTRDMHRKPKLNRLADRRHLRTMEYMYKVVNELLPPEVCNMFKLVRERHNRATRASTGLDLVIPNPRLEICKNDIRYWGPLYWNMVDIGIRRSESYITFKNTLRSSDMFEYE